MQEDPTTNTQVSAKGEDYTAALKAVTTPKYQAVGVPGRKPTYRPKPLALMVRRAIIQMQGAK